MQSVGLKKIKTYIMMLHMRTFGIKYNFTEKKQKQNFEFWKLR